MTIIASTELILIQTMCSSKLRMDFFHSGKHIMDIILLIRRVMLGAPSLWEIICKWPALWCCRVINKSSYQNEKWNFKNERVSINLGHWWERVAFGDERGVVKAVCDLGLVKDLHGVYATIVVASDLWMEWKEGSYLEDTTEASLS